MLQCLGLVDRSGKISTTGGALWAIVGLGLFVRLLTLTRTSLWFDEGFSLWFAEQSVEDLFGDLAFRETNPLAYPVILKIWMGLFGNSEFALRLLSTTMNVATAPLIFLMVKNAAPGGKGTSAGLLAALLFELTFFQIHIGQDLRAYAFLIFFLSGVLATATRMIRIEPDLAKARNATMIRSLNALALGLFMACAVWSHYTAFLFIGLVGIVLGLWWIISTRASKWVFLQLSGAAIIFLTLTAPAFFYILSVSGNPALKTFWLGAPGFHQILETTSLVFGAAWGIGSWKLEILTRMFLFFAWPALGLLMLLKSTDQQTRWSIVLFAATSVGLWGVVLAQSYLAKPIFLDRTLSPAQIGWVALSALGAQYLPWARLKVHATIGIIACWGLGALSYELRNPAAIHSEDWRGLMELIVTDASPKDVVGTFSVGATLAEYYATQSGSGSALQIVGLPPMTVTSFHATEPTAPFTSLAMALDDNLLDWVIIRDNNQKAGLLEVLSEHGYTTPKHELGALSAFEID